MSLSDFFKSPFGRRSEVSLLPPSPDVVVEEEAPAPPPAAVDFVAILMAAGVSPEQRNRVIKAQELLRTLPPDTPAALKRDIVEAAFKAFDVPTHEIVAAASSEIEALKAFVRTGEEHTQQILVEGNQQIAVLESKIAHVKASMDRAVAEQAMRARTTLDEMHAVQPVLQFFLRDSSASRPPLPEDRSTAPRSGNGSFGDGVDVQWEAGR